VKVPLASSGLREKDIAAIVTTLNSGNLTMGAKVREFEIAMASYLKIKHFVMVNSGSSANLLMIEALLRPTFGLPKLNPGDSVLLPAIAWPTTVWPIVQLGLKPIFADVDPNTLAIDLDYAQKLIDTSKNPIRGIFPIHPLGRAIQNSQLTSFSESNNLILVNDVCESLGSWDLENHAGSSGEASSFSFYFSHHLTTMEGGGIATNQDQYADDLRSMRSHGWSRERSDAKDWSQNLNLNDSKFLFVSTGYNVRPMEIQASAGLTQLQDLDNFVMKRRAIAKRVLDSLIGSTLEVIGSDTFSSELASRAHSWMLIPIRVTGEGALARKSKITEYLNSLGVETRPVLTGNFLAQPAIQRILDHPPDPMKFSNATKVSQTTFLVGAHHDLSEDQISFLCDTLNAASKIAL
jgi:CDP-4-dehydro-6-deoxyglucose reductase, E1